MPKVNEWILVEEGSETLGGRSVFHQTHAMVMEAAGGRWVCRYREWLVDKDGNLEPLTTTFVRLTS
jgi:hypothetical protein